MKKVLLVLCLAFLFAFSPSISSQEKVQQKNVASFSLFGSSLFMGVTYERLFWNRFSAEVTVEIQGFGAGLVAYVLPVRRGRLSPYVGVKYSYADSIGVFFLGPPNTVTYFPIGLMYANNEEINFGFDIGPGYSNPRVFQKMTIKDTQIYIGAKVGFRF